MACAVLAPQSRGVDSRLALFYLFDTLCKNRRMMALYRSHIAPFIAPPFISTHKHANEVTRKALDKLLAAWRNNAIFEPPLLDHIEAMIRPPASQLPPLEQPPAVPSINDPRKRGPPTDDAANKVSPAPQPPALRPLPAVAHLLLSAVHFYCV